MGAGVFASSSSQDATGRWMRLRKDILAVDFRGVSSSSKNVVSMSFASPSGTRTDSVLSLRGVTDTRDSVLSLRGVTDIRPGETDPPASLSIFSFVGTDGREWLRAVGVAEADEEEECVETGGAEDEESPLTALSFARSTTMSEFMAFHFSARHFQRALDSPSDAVCFLALPSVCSPGVAAEENAIAANVTAIGWITLSRVTSKKRSRSRSSSSFSSASSLSNGIPLLANSSA
mmetsp:Transcript_50981/g.143506  ORF Transcript_50981/g.143506 Transcript_50981/m.143506 type:complete len:233 (+) Transcript_50981:648-1346(+)